MERITFPGSTGATLSDVLHVPDSEVRGSVLLAHCFTCSKDLHTTSRLARALEAGGYAALRFDFTGLGDSEGDFVDTTVTHDVRDIVQEATALLQRGYGPCAMVGHSLGGAATLLAAQRRRRSRTPPAGDPRRRRRDRPHLRRGGHVRRRHPAEGVHPADRRGPSAQLPAGGGCRGIRAAVVAGRDARVS
jgi:pimeloyl-ACP methyl ester carboxylesterase